MGRAPRFDCEAALGRATALFWRHGYAGTSLRALLETMGIGEGSFYNTLKSKKRLFLDCLGHYEATAGRARAAILADAPSAAEGVRAIFRAMLDGLDDPDAPRACLIARSIDEEVLADPELRAAVARSVAGFAAALAARLAADQGAGRFPNHVDPEAVAAVVATYARGLAQSAMIDYDRPRFERQVDLFLKGLSL